MRRDPRMSLGKQITNLEIGKTLVVPFEGEKSKIERAVRGMISRRRLEHDMACSCSKTEVGMKDTRRAGPTPVVYKRGPERGPLASSLIGMARGDVVVHPWEPVQTPQLLRIRQARTRIQLTTGRVYRINQTPEGVRVERRA